MAWLILLKEWNRGYLRQDRGRQGSKTTAEVESRVKIPVYYTKKKKT